MLDRQHELADSTALPKLLVEKWIKNGPDAGCVVDAEKFGRYIAFDLKKAVKKRKDGSVETYRDGKPKTVDESVTTSQIRQVFSKLKTIEAKGMETDRQRTEFIMLKPYLAYASGRQKITGLDRLKERLTWAIDAVLEDPATEKQRFYNFCKFFEAILAYHRAFGGK